MRVEILGSGSRGNALVIDGGDGGVMAAAVMGGPARITRGAAERPEARIVPDGRGSQTP